MLKLIKKWKTYSFREVYLTKGFTSYIEVPIKKNK